MSTAHILLVEDEVKLARFIELELSSEGYQIQGYFILKSFFNVSNPCPAIRCA